MEKKCKSKNGIHILENYEPYDEMRLDCELHALLPALKYFGISDIPILLNEISIYAFNNKTEFNFCIEGIERIQIYKLIERLGVNLKIVSTNRNILKDTMTAINKKSPVIIWIDTFYNPIDPSCYNKSYGHHEHIISIFGYSKSDKVFHILDHMYKDSYRYAKFEVAFNDIQNAYNGYLRLRKDTAQPSYLELSSQNNSSKEKSEICIDTYKIDFFNFLLEKKEKIINGIEKINIFLEYFENIVFDEVSLKNNVEDIINVLNSIINSKNKQRSVFFKVFGKQDNILYYQEKIITAWGFIRGILVKYYYSSISNQKDLTKCIDKLAEVYDFEHRLNDNIFEFIVNSGE